MAPTRPKSPASSKAPDRAILDESGVLEALEGLSML